jgi:NAD(P)H-dependent FMN reductase/ketosteroid isomerase-like protein
MRSFDIAVLVGSLRKGSHTRKVARALIDMAPASLRCRLVEIGDLAMYNEDLDGSPPENWVRFRREIAAAKGVLLLTPEYNRSIPACLKNALDVGSRPQGKSVWAGKPAGIVSVTPYKLGAFGANHALRQALVFLDVPAMQQPEAYIANAGELFDTQGVLKSGETRTLFAKFLSAFAHWVATLSGGTPKQGFDAFMQQREEAASAYVRGDAAPLDAMVAREGTATFYPPFGGRVSGATEVARSYDEGAKSFSPDGRSKLEILQSGASGGLAFWTGFQEAEVKMGGKAMKMRLRITELFHLRDGAWKLVHRHADTMAEEKK